MELAGEAEILSLLSAEVRGIGVFRLDGGELERFVDAGSNPTALGVRIVAVLGSDSSLLPMVRESIRGGKGGIGRVIRAGAISSSSPSST
jgi:hypothetical protein